MNLIIRLIINAIAFWLIAKYVPGIHMSGLWTPIIAAIIFGIVNAIVRPLVLLLTLPLTVVTLGIFIIIVNALMFWLVAVITPNFHVDGFMPALIGAIIMMIVSFIVAHIFKAESESARPRPANP